MSKKADAVGTDLAAPEAASELAAKVRDLVGDKLDIVVANAGISKAGRMEDHTMAEVDNLFATNVRAPFFLYSSFSDARRRFPCRCDYIVGGPLFLRARPDRPVRHRCPPMQQPRVRSTHR